MKYTFHNGGTVTSFDPRKLTADNAGRRITMLDFHTDLVRTADRRDVYILDNKGREVECIETISLKKAA